MRVCVILPAAGAGKRFGGDKLSIRLGQRPLLLRTVELFQHRDEVAHLIVAAPPEPDEYAQFRARYETHLGFLGATIVPGGRRERWETVMRAIDAVPANCTHIAVHDAARPAASAALIDRVFHAARRHDAVIPGVPVSATLKRVGSEAIALDDDGDVLARSILGSTAEDASPTARRVEATVPRAGLVAVQTPQVFRASLLRDAYASAERAGTLDGVTDDAQVVERFGHEVIVVDGEARNIKVTTPDDVALVQAILGVGSV